MLRKLSLGLLVAIALMTGFVSATVAQRTQTLAALEPFLVDIQQTVPFSLTLTLPETGESVTVPSELDVALSIQIRADGSISPTVKVAEAEPVIGVSVGESSVDDLGIDYIIEIDSPDLTITEWTAFTSQYGYFYVAGEVYLAPDADPIQDVSSVARFYDSDGDLVEVEEIVNVGYALEPGEYNRFELGTPLDPAIIDHYTVSFEVIR